MNHSDRQHKSKLTMQPQTASKTLQFLATVLCLSIPNLHDYNGLLVWYIIYVLLFLLCNIAVYVWSMIGKVNYVYTRASTTVVLDAINSAILTANVIVYVCYAVFVKRKGIVGIVRKLRCVEDSFEEKLGVGRHFFPVRIAFGVLLGITALYTVEILVVSETVSTAANWIKYGLMSHLHVAMASVLVLQIYDLALRIERKFTLVNNFMYTLISDVNRKCTEGDIGHDAVDVVRFFLRTYDDLCDVIEMVSNCYGLQMLLFVWLAVVKIIFYLNFGFKLGYKIHLQQHTDGDIKENDVVSTYTILALWCLLFISLSMLLASGCGQATERAKETFSVCCKLLSEIPANAKHPGQKKLRDSLTLMVEHLGYRNIRFTAFGFLYVDYTMLFTILGSVLSYLVITLQFD